MPDPFATADQATALALPLPAATADGLLARATQAITDAAGFGILSETVTVRLRAEHDRIRLRDVPLVTAVSGLALIEDGTPEAVTGWHWPGTVAGQALDIWLERHAPGRHCGVFAVTLTHGLASVPDSLVLLASQVAYRLAAIPPAAAAGIASQSVGSVSWSLPRAASGDLSLGDLTEGEARKLRGIVPLSTVRLVRFDSRQ